MRYTDMDLNAAAGANEARSAPRHRPASCAPGWIGWPWQPEFRALCVCECECVCVSVFAGTAKRTLFFCHDIGGDHRLS